MTCHYSCFINKVRWLGIFILGAAFVGCSTLPPVSVDLNSQQHQSALAKLNNWQIRGKLGFKSPEKKQSASLSWEQKQDDYQLSLNSILGTSILSMQGNHSGATLIADDETHSGNNASELIWQITGWTLPVEQLPVWIKGQSLPNDKVVLAEQGWITQLQPTCENCEGWLINYAEYALNNQQWLPHKIVLLNQHNQLQVTIKINTWIVK
ncbi:lipoprotein insertase outer membrane protein LolB [Paraglaciecola hydrolytica]|uniref:Outer-membrane lipoprotein LolB n=1 Tax=Paraglaciecola hydrolytica TaxID=1799789 RepID=A0A136A6J3_9ALTE|nr:lipoprotein insertase outer membrane protein LolB [Paraglaciecola hydrolytica]KXI30750.1 outer membrane lipoprotein LolB [Paraglaciecola hydrolytica]